MSVTRRVPDYAIGIFSSEAKLLFDDILLVNNFLENEFLFTLKIYMVKVLASDHSHSLRSDSTGMISFI